MRKLWRALLRPSARWSILALVIVGIVIGVALIVLPHVGIKLTSTTEFCVSCHSMQPIRNINSPYISRTLPAYARNATIAISPLIFQAW